METSEAAPKLEVQLSQNSKGSFQITCTVEGCNPAKMQEHLDDLLKRARSVVIDNGFVLA